MKEPQYIASRAMIQCTHVAFGLASDPTAKATELVKAEKISPEQAAEGIRNKYAADASKGMTLLTAEERERNDPKEFKAALDALEASCIAYLYA